MSVLVTGAAGFLGSVLIEKNPSFLAMDTHGGKSHIYQFDIRDEVLLENFITDKNVT